jgi:sec-independent protein translocase protein TatC
VTRSPDAISGEGLAHGEMTLVEHLGELRQRLAKALVALAIGVVVGYAVFPYVIDLLIAPYCDAVASLRPGGRCSLVALRPLEPFSVRMKTSVVIGLFVGGPVIFYQLWRFITPGLTSRERRYALPFVIMSQVMFTVGIVFAYTIIPYAIEVLLGFGGERIDPFVSANEYLSFFLTMSVAFGLVFELPLVLIFLSLAGITTAASLRRSRRYAIVGIVVLAAFVTPTTDAVTLFLLAGPMLLFYEASIVVAWFIERRRRRVSA